MIQIIRRMKLFKTIIVDESIYETGIAQSILRRLDQRRVRVMHTGKISMMFNRKKVPPRAAARQKNMLILARQTGEFLVSLKPHPAVADHLRTEEHHVRILQGCPYDCRYCYLQSYLSFHGPTIYCNAGKNLETELRELIRNNENRNIVLTTGDQADSLALHEITEPLYERFFEIQDKAGDFTFEFRTKSAFIPNLPEQKRKSVRIAWSVNPQALISRYERKTPSLLRRLQAADKCLKLGIPTALRIDPIILTDQWAALYKKLADDMEATLQNGKPEYILLGSLKLSAKQRRFLTELEEDSLVSGELFKGVDDLYRYFRPIRQRAYFTLAEYLEKIFSGVKIKLSMEQAWMQESLEKRLAARKQNL